MCHLKPWVGLAFLAACTAVRSPAEAAPELSGQEGCLATVELAWDTMTLGAQGADTLRLRPSGRDRLECEREMARWIAQSAEDLSNRRVRVWVVALEVGEATEAQSGVADWFTPLQPK